MEKKKNRGGKRRKIFGEGKYLFKEEKENEDNVWRMKIFGPRRRRRTEKES